MNNKDIADEWFDFAVNDLNSARFLLQMRPIPLEIICYHCQQSAEKYLKGYIALNGDKIIKTHDLTLLNKRCMNFDKDFQKIKDDCIELVDYGVQVRYPFNIELEEQDMKMAIESAERIEKFILDKLKQSK
ncbi:HEPN domain-containing protein [Tepidibacter formicigenes]|jgi:HEPN domain-containing protein|uniref:HEPN domain-containing protein n=1 Tax=Tepidibacter formicigenes DSM 15518 TaxID=1123349 RepID=A0A1M6NJN8_9FIRM|nr:HEPN domain-containing protein [Tepidibacter formicigenes]SHJ95893.1 HEPN domain-containing protein [Tepidibacter formicigenes DSM 15518]